MSLHEVYTASPIKRRRATQEEMEDRAVFFIEYARQHGPITVRGLYYQAEVRGIPGIDKTEAGYTKVQQQVLALRRAGRLQYEWIADATRWMRKPNSYSGIEEALASTARFYRKSLWRDAAIYLEVWCEKDALAGVIYPVTSDYDVPLMVARGFSSETFCYEAVASRGDDKRPYHVVYLGDFDRSGKDAERSLKEKLIRFAAKKGIEVVFTSLAVTLEQVEEYDLPTRPHKRQTTADQKWPHSFACELDAIAPDEMRRLIEEAINEHLSKDQLWLLQQVEASERTLLQAWVGRAS